MRPSVSDPSEALRILAERCTTLERVVLDLGRVKETRAAESLFSDTQRATYSELEIIGAHPRRVAFIDAPH